MSPSGSPSLRSRWIVIVGLAVVVLGGFIAWRVYSAGAAKTADAARAPPPAIPVTVAPVRKADFPVYLTGLGVVEPYDTVTVSSRVDGEIIKVDFKQGQMVKEGDVLAEIDPRPYQAALDQALAKKSAGRGDAQERATQPAALHHARQGGFRLAPATRHATGDGRSTHRADQGRSGGDRQRPDRAELHHHPLALDREDRLSPRRSRQHRPCERHHRHRDDRQAAADLGRVHRARSRTCRASTRPSPPASCRSTR